MPQDPVVSSTEVPSPAGYEIQRYLPPAYLASWAVQGPLCAMYRVAGEIAVESISPDAAVFAPQPRETEAPSLELVQIIEQQLAVLALAEPAVALEPILEHRAAEWDTAARENWARFIVSMLLRHPSVVTQVGGAMHDILETGAREMQTRYASKRSNPKTFAEFVTRADPQAPILAAGQYLQKVMNGAALAATITRMHRARIDVANARFTLLTSDQPLDLPLNLADKNAYIALPLSPAALFVASNNPGLLDTLARQDPSKVVRMMNLTTVTHAHACVFSVDDSQLAFVKHHFGTAPAPPSLSDGPRQEALAALTRRSAR